MHNILKEIVKKKKEDLVLKTSMPDGVCNPVQNGSGAQQGLDEINQSSSGYPNHYEAGYKPAPATRDFKNAIIPANPIAIIAEIKLASPTAGILGSEKDILDRAVVYENAGADAISFITEKHYFKGDVSFIPTIREKISIPVLQKDFVIDESQIYEAKQAGSNALLLIAKLVDTETLQKFVILCQQLGIEPVVEINDEEDLTKAVVTKTNIIAVNARDLETFTVDVGRACQLLKKIPDKFIRLGFSGIHSRKEVEKYKEAGVKGVLIGTELMRSGKVEEFMKGLL